MQFNAFKNLLKNLKLLMMDFMKTKFFESAVFFSALFSALFGILLSCTRPVSEEKNLEAQTLFEVGVSQLQDGNFPDAISNLDAASALRPDSADIQLNLGLAYFGAEKHPEAIQHISRACGMRADFALCWNNLSSVYLAAGQYQAGFESAEKAISIIKFGAPELSWGNKGDALFHLGKLPESRSALERAVKLDPKHCRNRALLSRTLLQSANFNDARQQDLLIRRFCPSEPQILLWEAYLSYRLGFISEARKTFEAIITGFSDKAAIASAQNYLRDLDAERTLRPPAI